MMWFTNRAVHVPGIPQTTATITDRRPDPRYFELRRVQNASNAYFDAARIDIKAPAWRGVTLDASYWFSRPFIPAAPKTILTPAFTSASGTAHSHNLAPRFTEAQSQLLR